MILVDTSVWVDHLRKNDLILTGLLERRDVLVHPWVTSELALGNLHNRDEILELLTTMPQAPKIDHETVLEFIDQERLYGLGIGLVDVHLLASTRALPNTLLWTRDRRLGQVAARLGYRYDEETSGAVPAE